MLPTLFLCEILHVFAMFRRYNSKKASRRSIPPIIEKVSKKPTQFCGPCNNQVMPIEKKVSCQKEFTFLRKPSTCNFFEAVKTALNFGVTKNQSETAMAI